MTTNSTRAKTYIDRRAFMQCLGAGAAALAGAAAFAPAAGPDSGETVVFAEKFDSKLRDGWSWVRELPEAWKLSGGELVLTVQPSYLHPWGKEARNILLRELPTDLGANWAVEVKVDSDPKKQYEHAGVLIYWDDDNYNCLNREFLEGQAKLQMVTTKKASAQFAVVNQDLRPLWLRLEVHGEDVTSLYRAGEKDAWRIVGKNKLVSSEKPRCGILSGGAPKDAGCVAKFSNFRIVRLTATTAPAKTK